MLPIDCSGVFARSRSAKESTSSDVTAIPCGDAAFDVAVCEQVLEHVDDPRAALVEIARCLRPEGLLVFGVPTFPPGIAQIRDAQRDALGA